MGRVINTNNPTSARNYSRRTIAEMLRLLSHKPAMDAEARDMAATLVYALRDIQANVQQSAEAWEKRGYWMKAERFLREWDWVKEMAYNLEDVLRYEAWDLLPELFVQVSSRVEDIEVTKTMRTAITWNGAYARLLAEPPSPTPW